MDPQACFVAFLRADYQEACELQEAYTGWTDRDGFLAVDSRGRPVLALDAQLNRYQVEDDHRRLDLRTARRVALVPYSDRGSAAASGTYTSGAYASEYWVHPICASAAWLRELLTDDYGCVRARGVAWLRRHNPAEYEQHLGMMEVTP